MSIKVLALSGSLRKKSFNSALLREAQKVAPAGMTIEIGDYSAFPLYNEDVREQGFPPAVQKLRDQIKAADALLFSVAEYNFSVSGVLKNAIDWASRPPDQPFDQKPYAVIGAAGGPIGTGRAQYHLRQMMVFLNSFALNKPEVFVGAAHTKFDADGNLTDPVAKDLLGQLLKNLVTWTDRVRAK